MTAKLIVATDLENAIGHADGRLPWKLKTDMQRFKSLTTGSTVFMGRSTFLSLGRPAGLPNRRNVVLTRQGRLAFQQGQIDKGVDVTTTLDWIKAHQAPVIIASDLWIIGGAQVYDAVLDMGLIDEIHLTIVDTVTGAEVKLQHDLANWKLFMIHEQEQGRNWVVQNIEHVPDGDGTTELSTTYIILRKI